MNAEFQWWLLILGIVIGGALVYLVLADVQGDRAGEDPDEADESDLPDGEPLEEPVAGAPVADAGRSGRASVANDPDVEGDRAEAETPIADAP